MGLQVLTKSVEKMTDSNQNWGAFTPVMPAFIRLVAGVIVLLVIEAVVLGFPGIQQNISGTSLSVANVAVFLIGLIVAFIVIRFGTQLTNAFSDAYKAYKSWTPLLGFIFQILAIAILYAVSASLLTPYFAGAPWAIPLIFLLTALIPTMRAVSIFVHNIEGHPSSQRHNQN